MLKHEEETIDDFQFTTVQFPAMYAIGLLTRLVKSVGPAMSALSGFSPETSLASIAPALTTALSSLEPEDAKKLILEILNCTSVWLPDATGGRKIEFTNSDKINEFFSGRLKTMFKTIGLALRVNYQDFASGSVDKAKDVPAAPALLGK